MSTRPLPAAAGPALARMIQVVVFLSLLLGLAVTLAAPTAAQGLDCQTLSQDTAQDLLYADPSFADVLDPDGDGVACNHGGGGAPTGDVLDARFGGTRDSFEAAYGGPTGDGAEDYPLGWEYEFDGFGTAYVFYDRDRIIYMTLVPERGRAWTVDEAGEALVVFLPLDIEVVGDGEQTRDFVILYGYSDGLAEQVRSSTYSRYDISGEPGSLYTVFQMTNDGDVAAVEIALGDEIQTDAGDDGGRDSGGGGGRRPRGGGADGGSGAAESEYLATLTGELDMLADSVDRFYALLNDPNLSSEAAADELSGILTTWALAYETAKSLTPPPGYEEIHAAYLGFTELLAGAAYDIANGDAASAVVKLEQAQEQLLILTDLAEGLIG